MLMAIYRSSPGSIQSSLANLSQFASGKARLLCSELSGLVPAEQGTAGAADRHADGGLQDQARVHGRDADMVA